MALTQHNRGPGSLCKGGRSTEEAGAAGRPCEDTGQRRRGHTAGTGPGQCSPLASRPPDPGSSPPGLGGGEFQGSPVSTLRAGLGPQLSSRHVLPPPSRGARMPARHTAGDHTTHPEAGRLSSDPRARPTGPRHRSSPHCRGTPLPDVLLTLPNHGHLFPPHAGGHPRHLTSRVPEALRPHTQPHPTPAGAQNREKELGEPALSSREGTLKAPWQAGGGPALRTYILDVVEAERGAPPRVLQGLRGEGFVVAMDEAAKQKDELGQVPGMWLGMECSPPASRPQGPPGGPRLT